MKNVLFTAIAAVTITLAGAPARAQTQSQKDAGPDPAHVQELIKQAQQQLQPVEQPAGQRKPFVTPGPRVDLSLQDAVQRAADKNIDIAVARITPRLTDFTIASLDANYRPNLTSTGNSTRTVNLPRVTTQGINDPTTSTTQAWSAGLAQNLFHGGGNYSISLDEQSTEQRGHDQPPQPAVPVRADRHRRPAPAARLQDRFDTRGAQDQPHQPAERRDHRSSRRASARRRTRRTPTGIWCTPFRLWKRRRIHWISRANSFRTIRRASRLARSRRSTSCLRSRKPPTAGRRSCRRRPMSAPLSWRSSGSS